MGFKSAGEEIKYWIVRFQERNELYVYTLGLLQLWIEENPEARGKTEAFLEEIDTDKK